MINSTAEKIYPYSSPATLLNQHGVSGVEKNDDAFDEIELLNLNEEWFDAEDKFDEPDDVNEEWVDAKNELYDDKSNPHENILAGEYADSQVPVTEDLLRCVTQIVRMLGEAKKTELFSQLLAKIFPVVPFNIITAVNSLCTAIRENKQIDIAVLNTLSLASWCLPDDMNIVSRLAVFIRETIISWTGASFLRDGPGEDDGHQQHLYMALAVAAVVGSHFISGADAPQRTLFRVPAFAANLLLRAHMYWKAVGAMVHNVTPPEEPAHLPAFEVETCIATTLHGAESADSSVSGAAQKVNVISFSSNSTVNPGAYTKATVENRSTKTQGATYSVEQQAHALVTDRLMRYSGLLKLLACTTRQTETRQRQHGVEITHTYFNTKCEAIKSSEPLHKPATLFEQQTQEPASRASSAAERSHVYTILPMVASAAPVVNTWTQALKSTEMRVAGGTAVLTGLAFGARKIWNTFAARNDGEAIPPSQDAHKGVKHHHRTESETIYTNLAKKMQKLDIIDAGRDAGSFKKEEIIAAVGIYLFAPYPHFIHYINGLDDRLEKVAKTILRAKKLYGGGRDEEVSAARAGMLVRNWLFDTVLGMPVESWIAGKLAVLKHPEQFNASVMKTLLNSDVLRSARVIDLEALSDGQRQLFKKFWDYALDNTLPFTNFLAADEVTSLSATDDAFVWLHSGALWLKDAGAKLSDFSAEECQTVGKAIWQRVESGDIDISYQRYLTLPALLFEAVNHPKRVSHRKKNTLAHRLQAVEQYAEYRRAVVPASADLRAKMDALNAATKSWKSREAIADKYVERCPEDKLIQRGRRLMPGEIAPPLFGTYFGTYFGTDDTDDTDDDYLEKGRVFAKNDYLNDETPSGCPDVSVTAEYERETRGLAGAFTAVDHYSLAAAMGGLAEEDIRFIHSDNAVIRQVAPYLRETEPHSRARKYLKNTDLFSAEVDGTERIYAFIRKEKGDYVISRVDRDIEKYAMHGLFDIRKFWKLTKDDGGSVMLPEYSGGPQVKFQLFFPKISTGIDGTGKAADNIVNHFKEKRHSEFYDGMWSAGYDATAEQKLNNFLKILIPFYECANGNIVSCVFDVISVIPLFGKSVSLAGKFGQSLFKAMSVGVKFLPLGALSVNAVKMASQQALKQISLPTISELSSLSKTAILTLDPGFELLAGAGKYSYKGITTLTDWASAGVSADEIKKIFQKIKSANVKKTEQVVDFKKASLPDSTIKVPIKWVKQDSGKELYVIVDPVTGEALGGFYYLDGEKLVSNLPGKLPKPDDSKFGKKGSGRKKTVPESTDIPSLCSGRSKRGIDEICASVAFKDVDVNGYIKFRSTGGHVTTGFFPKKLLEINPVRYKILKGMMHNTYSVSRFAAKEVSKMTNDQVVESFGKYTRVKISEQQAIGVKNKVQEIKDACDLYYAQYENRVVLYPGAKDGCGALFFNYDTYGIFVTDLVFEAKNPSLFMHSLLHEASHALGTDDYFYLPKDLSFSGGQSVIDFCSTSKTDVLTFYKNHLMKLLYDNGASKFTPGQHMYKALNIPQNPDLRMSDAVVKSRMKEEGITLADWTVNNADSLSFYILAVGTEKERKTPHLMNVDYLFNDPKNMEKFPIIPD